jgi:hypothetical protein
MAIKTIINKTISINTPTAITTLLGIESLNGYDVDNENRGLCTINGGNITMLSASTAAYVYFKETASGDTIQLVLRGLGISTIEARTGKGVKVNPSGVVSFSDSITVAARDFTPGYAVKGGFLRKKTEDAESLTLEPTDTIEDPNYCASNKAMGVVDIKALKGEPENASLVFQLIDTHPELAGLNVSYKLHDGTDALSYYEKEVSHVEYIEDKTNGSYTTRTVTETVKVHKDPTDLEEVIWTSAPVTISGVVTPSGVVLDIDSSYKLFANENTVSLHVNSGSSRVEDFYIKSSPYAIDFVVDSANNAFTFNLDEVRPGRYTITVTKKDDLTVTAEYKVVMSGRTAEIVGATKGIDGEDNVTYTIRKGAVCSINYYSEPVDDPKYVWFESDDTTVASVYNDGNRAMIHSLITGVGEGTATIAAYINASGRKKEAGGGSKINLVVAAEKPGMRFIPLDSLTDQQKKDMNLFDTVQGIFAYADRRLVFTSKIEGFDVFYVVTNEGSDTDTTYTYELAMLDKDYIKMVSAATVGDNGGGNGGDNGGGDNGGGNNGDNNGGGD